MVLNSFIGMKTNNTFKMKKLNVLLAFALLLTFAACGSSEKAESAEQTPTPATETVKEEEGKKLEVELDVKKNKVEVKTDEVDLKVKGDQGKN